MSELTAMVKVQPAAKEEGAEGTEQGMADPFLHPQQRTEYPVLSVRAHIPIYYTALSSLPSSLVVATNSQNSLLLSVTDVLKLILFQTTKHATHLICGSFAKLIKYIICCVIANNILSREIG